MLCKISFQVAKVVHEMVEPVLEAESVVSVSSRVQELDWLISLLPPARLATIPARFMDQVRRFTALTLYLTDLVRDSFLYTCFLP